MSDFDSFAEPPKRTLSKDIPFTIENMQKAYDNLMENTTATSFMNGGTLTKNGGVTIQPSHYYYRFLPSDSLQYDQLQQDSVLEISEAPLDGAIDMDSLYQALQTTTQYPYCYSVFPVGYNFPTNMTAEKLGEFYFPPEDTTNSAKNAGNKGQLAWLTKDETSQQLYNLYGSEFFDILEKEAIHLTGNLEEEEMEALHFIELNTHQSLSYNEALKTGHDIKTLSIDYSKYGLQKASKWWPSGHVRVEEGILTALGSSNNILGVEGAEVKVRKWGFLVYRTARTGSSGHFSTSKTRTSNVKYAVYFNYPNKFRIRSGTIYTTAKFRDNANHRRRAWDVTFTGWGINNFHALIQNAAYDYYGRIASVNGPYKLRLPRKTDIYALPSSIISSQARPYIFSGFLPIVADVRISRFNGNGRYRGSDGIYATVIHELTHIGHREMDSAIFSFWQFFPFNKTTDLLRESWAEGVETIVTNDRYDALASNYNSRWNYGRQLTKIADMNEYTPIVADLIDNFNQSIGDSDRPIDRVNGYTLLQIQNALNNCRTINAWENNLRNYYSNPTENNLTELFDYVRTVRLNL